MKVLVIGGAGYIGSLMVKYLARRGCAVTTLDDLSSGHVKSVRYGDFIFGNFGDPNLINQTLAQGFDAIMHFASHMQVGESVKHPEKYYQNNLINTFVLLNAMRKNGVRKIIFSSSAAIFGEPEFLPIGEDHPLKPISPYGRTKLMVEQILADYDAAYHLKYICLRYFNAAGADPEGELGERHEPETHLIPLALKAAMGKRKHVEVHGRNYDTSDGTCVRDYVHVQDICSAHWLSLESLESGSVSQSYNLGNSTGYSVQEVIDVVQSVTGRRVPIVDADRRVGDPQTLIADSSLARERLGWAPRYSDLATIIEHAWKWEIKMPN